MCDLCVCEEALGPAVVKAPKTLAKPLWQETAALSVRTVSLTEPSMVTVCGQANTPHTHAIAIYLFYYYTVLH